MYECLFFLLIACHSWDLNVRIQPAAVMLVGRRWWGRWATGEEQSRSPSLEGYWGEPFIPLWPPDLTVTPTKWTALPLKLFNCGLISFIILLIQISVVSSEWKICIAWIILTPGPFNFCQQYFTAPIRALQSLMLFASWDVSRQHSLAPTHQGAAQSPCLGCYHPQWSCSHHCTGLGAAFLGISDGLWPCWALGYRLPFLSPQKTRQGAFLIDREH